MSKRQTGGLRRGRLGPREGLGADPDFAAVLADMDRAVHRLHRRVREERNLIGRLDLGHGTRHRAVDIADVLRDGPRLERRLLEFGRDRFGREPGMRTVVPFDRQGFEALLRGAHVVGNHGDGIIEPHDLAHALDGLGRGIVDALHAAAEYRRLREGRDLHAGRPDIDAVDGRSIDLRRRVETLGRGADQLEILRSLERDVVRAPASAPHRRRARHTRYVCRSARESLRRVRARQVAGSTFQRCAAAATSMVRAIAPAWRSGCHAPRIAFELPVACTPSSGIGVELFVGRGVLQPHLVEVHLQLFGDQHRDRRIGALAHFDIGHGQDDLAVTSDADEGVGREGRRRPLRLRRLRTAG